MEALRIYISIVIKAASIISNKVCQLTWYPYMLQVLIFVFLKGVNYWWISKTK